MTHKFIRSGMRIEDLLDITDRDLIGLPDDIFRTVTEQVLSLQQQDRQQNQLMYYRPVNQRAMLIHEAQQKFIGVGGGNGSSKTETCLVDCMIRATGVFPDCLKHTRPWKFRGPVGQRVVCESLTNVLPQVILPKLQWWKWTGVDQPGGERGHWGWIPRRCLIDGSWDRSWREKEKTLTVLCYDPEDPDVVMGESRIQFMSHDQDPSDFASGDYHDVLHDEPPRYAIWRENEARTMRVRGRMFLAMTWPDDPAIPIDWVFDQMYEPGMDPKVTTKSWFELWTTDNPHLDQAAVAEQIGVWSDEIVKVRIYGRPIRFSSLIHPLFTEIKSWWCFPCGREAIVQNDRCTKCDSADVLEYNHVKAFEPSPHWPTVFLIDPHPRKPHMWLHVQIDANDDLWVVNEGETSDTPLAVRTEVEEQEELFGLAVAKRLMDPNMGASPATAKERESTWQDQFDEDGLHCDLADDSSVGRQSLNEYLKPDSAVMRPRIHIHERCCNTIAQLKRYSWDEWKNRDERNLRQTPRDKYDDYPTLLKYLMNDNPSFQILSAGAPVIRIGGGRHHGY